jgi:hypothetical protein
MSFFKSEKKPVENVVAVMEVFNAVDQDTSVSKLQTQIFPIETPVSQVIEWGKSFIDYQNRGDIVLTIPQNHLSAKDSEGDKRKI